MNHMNIYGDFNPSNSVSYPTLVCIPSNNGTSGIDSWIIRWLDSRKETVRISQITPPSTPGGVPPAEFPLAAPLDNVWSILMQAEDEAETNRNGTPECLEQGNGPGGVDDNIGTIITHMIIKNLLTTDPAFVIDLNNLYATDGSPIAPTNNLPAGLYNLTLAYSNGELLDYTVEASTGVDLSYELSKMLDISVFPSPLPDNNVNFSIDPNYTGSVQYQLLDFNGAVVYSNSYNFNKGIVSNYSTHIPVTIPRGIIFHQFTMSDGSRVVVESIKN